MNDEIIKYILSQKPQTKAQFDDAKRKICGQLKMKQPSNRELLQAYQNFTKKERLEPDKTILMLIRKAGIRTQSGIAVVTSLTKPFP
ncbi:hypothetical protein KKA94_00575, partial [Patescibacteria group bacterium]|nr:hypothetical protein [Patescibacteria group bacterium]